jgi:hypothetical protein
MRCCSWIADNPQTGTNVRPPRYQIKIKHCRDNDAAKWISPALRTSPQPREYHVHTHVEVNAHLTSGIYLDLSCQHVHENDAWRLANANDGLMDLLPYDWSDETQRPIDRPHL